MRIANWNIEWMNRWFSVDSQVAEWRDSSEISGVTDIDGLATRVAAVTGGMNPDVLLIQEGPSRRDELQLFVTDYLNDDYSIVGPSGSGQQKLYALVRNAGAVQAFNRILTDGEVDLEEPWAVDIDGALLQGELQLEQYEFTRVPLVLDVNDGNRDVRLINVHFKSKYVHNGRTLWNNAATRPAFVAQAVSARRRISAEAMRLRAYLDELLQADPGREFIVAGDFNDGPGSDFFERLYLTHNLVASVSGNPFDPRRMLRHGFVDRVSSQDNFTAIFDDFVDEIDDRRILLDHILISPGLYWSVTEGRIDHAAFNAQVDNNLPGGRERAPSDHRPQWVEF